MNNIEDLKEIFATMQEIGVAWHEENILLRAENESLRKDNESLRAENESLRREFDNLSEKMVNLKQELRQEILDELKAAEQEIFQKEVKTYLKDIRDKINAPTIKAEEYQEIPAPAQDMEKEIQISDMNPYFD